MIRDDTISQDIVYVNEIQPHHPCWLELYDNRHFKRNIQKLGIGGFLYFFENLF